MSEDSLINHYQTNFQLMQHHNYSLSDLNGMIPFERQIYISLLETHLEQERDRIETAALRNQ
jgi:hypothetical protein